MDAWFRYGRMICYLEFYFAYWLKLHIKKNQFARMVSAIAPWYGTTDDCKSNGTKKERETHYMSRASELTFFFSPFSSLAISGPTHHVIAPSLVQRGYSPFSQLKKETSSFLDSRPLYFPCERVRRGLVISLWYSGPVSPYMPSATHLFFFFWFCFGVSWFGALNVIFSEAYTPTLLPVSSPLVLKADPFGSLAIIRQFSKFNVQATALSTVLIFSFIFIPSPAYFGLRKTILSSTFNKAKGG